MEVLSLQSRSLSLNLRIQVPPATFPPKKGANPFTISSLKIRGYLALFFLQASRNHLLLFRERSGVNRFRFCGPLNPFLSREPRVKINAREVAELSRDPEKRAETRGYVYLFPLFSLSRRSFAQEKYAARTDIARLFNKLARPWERALSCTRADNWDETRFEACDNFALSAAEREGILVVLKTSFAISILSRGGRY